LLEESLIRGISHQDPSSVAFGDSFPRGGSLIGEPGEALEGKHGKADDCKSEKNYILSQTQWSTKYLECSEGATFCDGALCTDDLF